MPGAQNAGRTKKKPPTNGRPFSFPRRDTSRGRSPAEAGFFPVGRFEPRCPRSPCGARQTLSHALRRSRVAHVRRPRRVGRWFPLYGRTPETDPPVRRHIPTRSEDQGRSLSLLMARQPPRFPIFRSVRRTPALAIVILRSPFHPPFGGCPGSLRSVASRPSAPCDSEESPDGFRSGPAKPFVATEIETPVHSVRL